MVELRQNVTRWVMTVEFQFQQAPMFEPQPGSLFETHLDPTTGTNERDGVALASQGGFMDPALAERLPPLALPDGWMNTPRNGMCPCGSGKKFKHCHGALI
jgi:preprotein translocase subunit SecA